MAKRTGEADHKAIRMRRPRHGLEVGELQAHRHAQDAPGIGGEVFGQDRTIGQHRRGVPQGIQEVLVVRRSRRKLPRAILRVVSGGRQPIVVDHVDRGDSQGRTLVDDEPGAVATGPHQEDQVVAGKIGAGDGPIQEDLVRRETGPLEVIEIIEEPQPIMMVFPRAAGNRNLVGPGVGQIANLPCFRRLTTCRASGRLASCPTLPVDPNAPARRCK